MITILFKDDKKNVYIAKKQDGKIIGFNVLLLSQPTRVKVEELLNDLECHEFLVVNLEEVNSQFKLEPLVSGSLIASDSEEELAVPLFEMELDKLLTTLNGLLPEKYLKN